MFQSLLSFLLASTLHLSSVGDALPNEPVFDDSVLLDVTSLPAQDPALIAPGTMSAAGVVGFDVDSHSVLWESNSQVARPIASLTKLMTAYIILTENDVNSVVTVSGNAASTIGSSMRIVPNEKITVKDLLYGLLIESGNDAAVALAEFNAGSEAAFVEKMNTTAKRLGLSSTHYLDSTGLSASNVSSPHDLAILSAYLIQNQDIRAIASQSEVTIISLTGQVHELQNTNILLGEMGIKGLKTGKTPTAGECLITLSEGENGHEVITVVLGSQDRFKDTRLFLDWIFRAFTW